MGFEATEFMPSSVFRGPENLARVSLEFSPCEIPICFSRSATGVVDLGVRVGVSKFLLHGSPTGIMFLFFVPKGTDDDVIALLLCHVCFCPNKERQALIKEWRRNSRRLS